MQGLVFPMSRHPLVMKRMQEKVRSQVRPDVKVQHHAVCSFIVMLKRLAPFTSSGSVLDFHIIGQAVRLIWTACVEHLRTV